jgi:cobalt-zinc-cadmium efflux system outer membrane protein
MKPQLFILFLILAGSFTLSAQNKPVPQSLSEFLSGVSKGNLGYAAEQFNVNIADAQLKAAKVFPDPELSFSYSNNQDQTLFMGQGIDAGISYPISMGNKRGANISLAKSQKELAQTALDAYFQNLRAEATLGYFNAIRQKKLLNVQSEIYDRMNKLAQADSLRLKNGSINATDARQTKLEARSQQNLVFQADADFQNSLIYLAQLQGKSSVESSISPSGDFPLQKRDFDLNTLIQAAIERRADLQLAIRNKEISEKQLRLIRANRAFEFALEAGYSHSTEVKNEIAPAPAFNSYSGGISIPLKLSTLNKGEILAAREAIKQSETSLKDIQLQITTEVSQAWVAFKASEKQMLHYKNGMIDEATQILDARTYSYQRGETGISDLLNAQRTFNEVMTEYYDTLYQYAESLVNLEKAAGIWDID